MKFCPIVWALFWALFDLLDFCLSQCSLIAKQRSTLFNLMSLFWRPIWSASWHPIWSTFWHPIWHSLTAPLFYLSFVGGYLLVKFSPIRYFYLKSCFANIESQLAPLLAPFVQKGLFGIFSLLDLCFVTPSSKNAFHPLPNDVLEPRGTPSCSNPPSHVDSNF